MNTHARYGLATWPESQEFIGNPRCILVNPPEDSTDLDSAYLRIPWPESQAWEVAPEGWDEEDVLHDCDTLDAYVLTTLYEEINA